MPFPADALRALPNFLTVLRFILALLLPFAPGEWQFTILLAAGFSDLVDGLISRALGAASGFGQFFDPIADKTLVISAAATALVAGWLTWIELLALASRDIAVVGLSVWAMSLDRGNWRKLTPRLAGKVAMAAQVSALLALFWTRGPWPAWVWTAAFFSALAAVDYSLHARRALRTR
jgi:cardiolipin synthase